MINAESRDINLTLINVDYKFSKSNVPLIDDTNFTEGIDL